MLVTCLQVVYCGLCNIFGLLLNEDNCCVEKNEDNCYIKKEIYMIIRNDVEGKNEDQHLVFL